ncbi:hypothetical protein [Ectopseudomonas alcaliphila]|uniref:Uncharacterized protein n=1 Tax=Ectopseudomonas alcaliphila TaxID=101564 RepID=A0A1G7JFV0_9GAMM|nr:hypothetical protein [Pseudomonas alcaliphila]MDX5990465.1 hypothetical protein [Pseudomonas alcaliphila]MDX5995435.1 hypothetical protein [Pseudomonas alcaliphila]MDX5995480.1 hypothetical protein [Pseudomonas alcaliphila]SDF23674.1 hypothetical protein SAMN05216575_106215 [Pseudomonas alcaliphila]
MNLFIHRMMGHYLMNEAPAADAPPAAAPATPPAATPPADGGNLLNQGADNDYIPEKYRVNGADGKLDINASSRKMAEAYSNLEKRVGTGDLPPKSVDDYAPKLEVEGFDWEEFKKDESSQAFLKGAHAKGLTNAQVEYVLGEYLKAAPQLLEGSALLDQQGATEALKGVWKSDAEFKGGLQSSYRAVQGFADQGEGLGSMANLMTKFGNDPDFIAFTARIGREMSEDTVPGGQAVSEADFTTKAAELRTKLQGMSQEDPQRKSVQAELEALYKRQYPSGNSRFK